MFRSETHDQKGTVHVSHMLTEKKEELNFFEKTLKALDNRIEQHIDVEDTTSDEALNLLKEYMRAKVQRKILVDYRHCTVWVAFSLDQVRAHIQDEQAKLKKGTETETGKEKGIRIPFSMFRVSAQRPTADYAGEVVVGMWCALGGAGGKATNGEEHAFRVRDIIYGDDAHASRDAVLSMVHEIEKYLYCAVMVAYKKEEKEEEMEMEMDEESIHARFHTMVHTHELVVGYARP